MIADVDKTTSLHLNNEVQFLCFTLEEHDGEAQLYAMNVFKIREIIYYDGEITETAGDNGGMVLGFLTVRGESIPLVDMRRWLYYSNDEPFRDLREFSIDNNGADKPLVVICNFSNYTVGLKILGVKRIIHKNWEEVDVGSEYGFGNGSKVTATTKYDDGSVIQVLDIEKMTVEAFPMLGNTHELELASLEKIKSNKVVLLAEDSKTAAKSLQKILEKLDLKYFTFQNGKALLDYLKNPGVLADVGAVITDLEMPVVSGFEVLKQIKSNPATAHLPVIVNSSMSSDSNKQMAVTLRADAFITKSNPIEIEQNLKELMLG